MDVGPFYKINLIEGCLGITVHRITILAFFGVLAYKRDVG